LDCHENGLDGEHAMLDDFVRTLEHDSRAWIDGIHPSSYLGRILHGDASLDEYTRFLVVTYRYVGWSGVLLAATAEGVQRGGRYPWLLGVLNAKAREEGSHDRWALSDLKALGRGATVAKTKPIPTAVDAYVQWSLTLAQDGSPAFLGAAYTLEFISMHRAKVTAENLCARAAIPNIQNAVSFLEGHGDADVGHIEEMNGLLRSITDPEDQAAILLSAAVMRTLYPRFFQPGAPPAAAPRKRTRRAPSVRPVNAV
jgi:hypothetical protein